VSDVRDESHDDTGESPDDADGHLPAPASKSDHENALRHPVREIEHEVEHLYEVADKGESEATPAIVSVGVLIVAGVAVVLILGLALGISYLATRGDDEQGAATTTAQVAIGTPPEVERHAAQFPTPNGDLANTRATRGSIGSSNVKQLGIAWKVPIIAAGAFGGLASTPIIAGNTVYTQDLDSNVQAISLASGKVLWTHRYNPPDVGPNGVAIGYGRI
jgi:glucose dehydrogenase